MNLSLIVLAVVVVACSAFVHGGDRMDEPNVIQTYAQGKLVGAFEKFRNVMKNGDPKLKVPVLDPLKIVQQPIAINEEGLLQLDGLVIDALANGLAGFIIHKADFKIAGLKTTFDLSWPEITGHTNYIIKGQALESFDIFGNGHLSAVVKNLDIGADLKFGVKSGKLFVSSISSRIALGELDLQITGLYDDEELSALMSVLISDMTPQIIADYQADITEIADNIIKEHVNEILKDMTVKDLLELMK